jgi:hypothetical protein
MFRQEILHDVGCRRRQTLGCQLGYASACINGELILGILSLPITFSIFQDLFCLNFFTSTEARLLFAPFLFSFTNTVPHFVEKIVHSFFIIKLGFDF